MFLSLSLSLYKNKKIVKTKQTKHKCHYYIKKMNSFLMWINFHFNCWFWKKKKDVHNYWLFLVTNFAVSSKICFFLLHRLAINSPCLWVELFVLPFCPFALKAPGKSQKLECFWRRKWANWIILWPHQLIRCLKVFQMMASCLHCLEVIWWHCWLKKKNLKARGLATIWNLSIVLAFAKTVD